MKAVKTFASLLMMILAINVHADTIRTANKATSPALPAFIWGSPEEIDAEAAELLKVQAPEFVWGAPEDINTAEAAALRPVQVFFPDRITFPTFVWGDPGEADASDLKK